MNPEELDKKFDAGEDVMEFFDLSTLKRPRLDEKEPNEQILADLATSIQEAKAGLTFPVSQLWDDLEAD